MRRQLTGSLGLSLILVMGAYGAPNKPAAPTNEDKEIRIRIRNYAQVDPNDLAKAERVTDDILHEAGVQAVWIECSAGEIPAKDPACAIPPGPTDLVLNLLPRSMSDRFQLGAERFGVALENAEDGFGFDAWIFCDLVRDAAAKKQLTRSVLLGTVMVHELGHLLLSTNSHSGFGVMQANWSGKELSAVEHRAMYFSSSESKRIQQAVMARRQSVVARTQSANSRPLSTGSEIEGSR